MLARGDAGGYIVPAARRAELIVSLAIRNLTSYCGGLIASGPDTYFRLIAAGSGAPIYRSEVARQTCNPSWLPIDWAQVTQDAHHRDERLKLNTVRVQVLLAARRSRPWDAVPEPAAGRAFFEAAGLLDAADVPALDLEVDLRTLRFIGADALGVLASIGSVEGGGAGAAAFDGGGGDGVAAAVLPLNAVVLQLEDGYYTPQPPQSDSPSGGLLESLALAAAGVAVGSPGGGALSPTARYDMRRSFDAINRLMQLRRDTGTAHAAARDAATTLAATLAPGLAPHAANVLSVELLERTARVGALRRKRDVARDAAVASREGVEAAHAALIARAQALKRAGEGLRELSDALPFMATAVEEVRGEVSLLRTLITAKQLSLVAELRALYPIQEAERGRQYTIRGLSMPHRDSFGALREEHLSTVLGYTAHTVSLLAKYLQVPLRYAVLHAASRSTMRDEVMLPAGREFPLFGRAAAPDEFACAVLMLTRDVRQLLYSQGLVAGDVHMLADLQRLFAVLLDAQLS